MIFPHWRLAVSLAAFFLSASNVLADPPAPDDEQAHLANIRRVTFDFPHGKGQ
jgi:hypothetical protein